MSNTKDLLNVIQKLASLNESQLDALLNSTEESPKRGRGRPRKKSSTNDEVINPQRRNGSLTTGPRVNEFESSELKNECKNDIKVDKLLNKGRAKRKKGAEVRSQMVDAKCTKCGQTKQAYAELTWKDFETDERVFTCDRCDNRRR